MRQKDEQKIREIIREELRNVVQEELNMALTRDITVRKAPPDSEPYNETERWNVLDFMAGYLPHIQGALLGMQEDVNKTNNKADNNAAKLQALGQTLAGMEQTAMSLVQLRDEVKQITENPGLVVRQAIQSEGEQKVQEAIDASDNL